MSYQVLFLKQHANTQAGKKNIISCGGKCVSVSGNMLMINFMAHFECQNALFNTLGLSRFEHQPELSISHILCRYQWVSARKT